MSRRVEDMHPALQPRLREFQRRCKAELPRNCDVLVTCTWRSNDEQAELYAQGRTKPGRIVTKAKPGMSKHNNMLNGKPASLAFDVVPLRYGKPIWGTKGDGLDDDPTDDDKDDLELWQRVAVIGKSLGFQWFGDPDSPYREFPHFQDATP